MKTITAQILQDLQQLPDDMQYEALDFVQFLKTKLERTPSLNKSNLSDQERGQAMANLFAEAARQNLFSEITDPVAWQIEVRQDRALPGRES